MARECLEPCPSCPRVNQPVPGDGPADAEIMFIGEAPGKDENRYKRPFVGRTGKEFNETYLPLAGLRRNDIYLTNTIKCLPRGDKDITEPIIDSCSTWHLRREIARINPKVVVLMGATACSLVGADLELQHGRPFEAEILGHRKWVFPVYHPAAGLHDSSYMIQLREDFRDLGLWTNGLLDFPEDEFPQVDYRQLTSPREVLQELGDDDSPIAIDTEFDPAKPLIGQHDDIPYCLTFTTRPGTGFLILARDAEAVGAFAAALAPGQRPPSRQFQGWPSSWNDRYLRGARAVPARRRRRGPVLIHNVMADHPVLSNMGVTLPWPKVRDTMVMSYHLGSTPQGLKALAYRLCGMRMKEFTDVVTPYAIEYCVAFIEMLQTVDWPKPEPFLEQINVPIEQEIDGAVVVVGTRIGYKEKKPQGLNTKLKRLMTDFGKKPTMEVFNRWKEWSAEEKTPAIERFGDMPRPSITMVPMGELLPYACRDSDATWRIFPILKELRRGIRRGLLR
jgi:uracil-DNA glycosylase family 4